MIIQISKRPYKLKGFNLEKGFTYMIGNEIKQHMPARYKLNFRELRLKNKDRLLPIRFTANSLNANKVFLNALYYAQGYQDAKKVKLEFVFKD